MKINYPTTQAGWLNLGELIVKKSTNLGSEAAINTADADINKIETTRTSAKKLLEDAEQLHKDAESLNEKGTQNLAEMQTEIRRVAKILTGRHASNLKSMGAWGFTMDESTPPPPSPGSNPPNNIPPTT